MTTPLKTGWLSHAGPYKIEHVPCPRPGQAIDRKHPPLGLLHTTQGGSIEGALAVFRVHYAPHFTVGVDAKKRARILQHVPLGEMAAALQNLAGGVETNREVRVQIEIVGFCHELSWLPADPTLYRLAALMAELEQAAGIPLRHPAVNRSRAKWLAASGWVGHVDAPENDHTDPGKLRYDALFGVVREIADLGAAQVKAKPRKKLPAGKTARLAKRAKKAVPSASCPVGENARAAQPITKAASTSAGTVSTVVVTTSKPKPRPKKKPAPKTRYYTLKRNVPLKRGQVIGYQPKKGYYARTKKAA